MIDLVATTEVQGFNITLNLGGTLERPDIHLASDANLADLEIFSLIAGSQRPTENPLAPPTTADQQARRQPARARVPLRPGGLGHLQAGGHPVPLRPLPDRSGGRRRASRSPGSASPSASGCRRTSSSPTRPLPTTGQQYIVQVEWRVRNNLTLVLTQVGDGTYAIDAQWQRRF